jgi:hypothetical protein
VYEDVSELWKRYLSKVAETWPQNDPRHNLAGEVRDRLRQLNRILRHLHNAIEVVTRPADPDEIARERDVVEEWAALDQRLANGEITDLEYFKAKIEMESRWPKQSPAWHDAWVDISIFTETFYHWAWRLIIVLRGEAGPPYKFPGGLTKVNVPVIREVRNYLIQHPENVKGDQNFTLGLVITSSGPVLRSLGAVIKGDSDRMEPLPESVDQGLFVAAERLRDELERRFDIAISKTAKA